MLVNRQDRVGEYRGIYGEPMIHRLDRIMAVCVTETCQKETISRVFVINFFISSFSVADFQNDLSIFVAN